MIINARFGAAAVAALLLCACSGTYYSAMERIGFEKRDILLDRVEDARDAQDEAAEQFSSALDQFRSMVDVDGGELERIYDRLKGEYERSEARAGQVSERIGAVERVAEDLFEEWDGELEEYANASLRADSARLLRDTRGRYRQLMAAMRQAESAMPPVLAAFRDQVLVLKHNLNARAIGALRNELGNIERDTTRLIADMRQAVAEANAFIAAMES